MNYKDINDFGRFAKDKGISGMNLHYFNQQVENSMTPYILEERSLNVTQMGPLMQDWVLRLGFESTKDNPLSYKCTHSLVKDALPRTQWEFLQLLSMPILLRNR